MDTGKKRKQQQPPPSRKVERSSQLVMPSDDTHPAAFKNPPDDGTNPSTLVFMLVIKRLHALEMQKQKK